MVRRHLHRAASEFRQSFGLTVDESVRFLRILLPLRMELPTMLLVYISTLLFMRAGGVIAAPNSSCKSKSLGNVAQAPDLPISISCRTSRQNFYSLLISHPVQSNVGRVQGDAGFHKSFSCRHHHFGSLQPEGRTCCTPFD
jgi:hypothetical protein